MNRQPFPECTQFFSDPLASRVARRNDDFNPDQSKLRKTELRQQACSFTGEALFDARGSDPVTHKAVPMHRFVNHDAASPQDLAGSVFDDREAKHRIGFPSFPAMSYPLLCVC